MSQSRAALSLLGFCYYHIQDFTSAAECYEQLTQLHPEVEEYKVYYAQSLYKAGAYPEATKASFILDNPSSHTKVQYVHTPMPKRPDKVKIFYCQSAYVSAALQRLTALVYRQPESVLVQVFNHGLIQICNLRTSLPCLY